MSRARGQAGAARAIPDGACSGRFLGIIITVDPARTGYRTSRRNRSAARVRRADEEVINHYRVVAKQEATQEIRALSVDAGLPPHATRLIVIHGDPSLRIIEQEQEQDCDLIVMGKHGESVLEELLVGSVTKHVLADSQCDVLVSV